MLRLGSLKRVCKNVRQFRDSFFSKPIAILLYHRVTSINSDPQALCISPDTFSQHLQMIDDVAKVVRLVDLPQLIKNKTLPERCVVITFDDGYADNFTNAKPILEQYDMPATIFVATEGVQQNKEYYWDALDHLLLTPGKIPSELNVSYNDHNSIFLLGKFAEYSESDYLAYCSWNVRCDYTPTLRHQAYRDLCALLTKFDPKLRSHILDSLYEQCGLQRNARETHRMVNKNELIELAKVNVIDIGAHTSSHPFLSSLPEHQQRVEILDNKAWLESLLDTKIETFSYPYGVRDSYTDITTKLVKDAGFTLACSNYSAPIFSWTNQFQLPRHVVPNLGVDEFHCFLETFLAASKG